MSNGVWKAKLDSMLHAVSRDLGDIWLELKYVFASLDTAERIVLLCLVAIGSFYLLLGHFQRGSSGDDSTVRFAGLMFGAVVLLASAGWMVSNGVA